MTLRPRPATRRSDRSRQSGRRTTITNIGFGVVVVLAVLILAAAAGVNYYGDHFASVASVNGHSLTRDDLRDRYQIDVWRLNTLKSRLRDEVQQGRMDEAQADQQISFIDQQLSTTQGNLLGQAVQQIIDGELQAQLASTLGLTVTDKQIDDRLAQEATVKEQRHAWSIDFEPAVTEGATEATTSQKEAAKASAELALTRLQKGQSWDSVAKSAGGSGSDLGFLQSDATDPDVDFVAALFKLKVGDYTPVIAGTDGTYRIGRITEIAPESVDPNYQASITNAGVSMDLYRRVIKSDLVREALQARVIADATTQPTEQREVSEIVLNIDTDQQTGQPITADQVKVRHILYAPTAPGASPDPQAGAPPSTDPSWNAAKEKAFATYEILKKDPSKFAEIAKKDSADTTSGADGGDLPYESQAQLDPAFGAAVFAPGLKKDQLLEPVASSFGWHVIQFIDRKEPAGARANGIVLQLARPGADFAALAKERSEGADAAKGGAMGWVARYQLSKALEDAIFGLAQGAVSSPITDSDKIYIFKVTKIETRLPAGDQLTTLKDAAFNNWYDAEKAKASISTDPAYQSTSG